MGVQEDRKTSLRNLTNIPGVYALCDLDRVPLYIGQSTDGIRTRVQRHLTSARSDVIANRQLDVWEISEVWAWDVDIDGKEITDKASQKKRINELEDALIHHFNDLNSLVNGKILPLKNAKVELLEPTQKLSILTEAERLLRLDPVRRLPRQTEHFNNLISHVLEVKNNDEQRRMLRVHVSRMLQHYEKFMTESGEREFYD